MDDAEPLVIVGGGLAGGLAVLALAQSRPGLPILLVEGGDTFGGNHVWSFFDSDLDETGKALVAPLEPVHWPRHEVRFDHRRRTLAIGYNSIRSIDLDRLLRSVVPPERLLTGTSVTALDAGSVTLSNGRRISARGVIDARGPAGPMPGIELAWQKFVGVEIAAPAHGLNQPIVMDGTVDQIDGYRFVYSLPFTDQSVFVEDTYYSDNSVLDEAVIDRRIDAYARQRGWTGGPVHRETGILPVVIAGDPDAFWPAGEPVARLGVAGGFFHSMTGYSLPIAAATALALARLDDFSTGTLARWTRERFLRHWQESGFYRLLARMLFKAARPEHRVRIFEHFYRLPEATIARFYAGRLTLVDKARILSGKPPVPILPAMKAILS